ncbi:GLPGLI family protein [Daejeonella oryzae]|uniref:GLPGLI family protein n=1 Tax=Daejeonella oryzae TaxID=1122943 RepID=UPI00047D4D4F|nr:GLPGLI family protein [Daejeonella oryzae]
MSKQFSIIILFCCFLTTYVVAQQKTSGVIYYTQVINLRNVGANSATQGNRPQRANMPESITNKMEIIYNANGARLQKSILDEDLNPDAGNTAGGGQMMMRFAGGTDREVFFNLADKKATESFEMNGVPYLLESLLGSKSEGFVKTDETKIIAGIKCKKAVMNDKDGNQTSIWYTNSLPFVASPVPSLWTEGVVMGVENQRMKYMASSIEYTKIKDSEITLPKKSTKISQEEYQVKQEEMRKKMREQFRSGGNGNVIIREGGN